ncbi:3'-5' exoribonuclease domain-containing protein [Tahibacter amnicola]|uniref:3'-5' exoribonuclease n=1 Tax=Tahibacter amnicola TaxID=2976241 RepID=A0ABY6BJS6_9GAMM|nr:3'-5' exoribonuclease [Tahibacter amnicola]UXI69856.1 3'-5' exoribonuclease [Tahibacter amnicola]
MPEIYVSTDIEADGPIPGPHSLLSLASAAFTADGRLLDTFSVTLDTLPDATGHPDTMAWWATQPDAWEAARRETRPAAQAMASYHAWLLQLPGKPVFVGYPASYDFLFVYWYLMRFVGHSPFGHAALDIKTFAMSLMRRPFRSVTKRTMPRRWFAGTRAHTHVALDDAIEQGELFCHMLREHGGQLGT